jgi:hypothetical protein
MAESDILEALKESYQEVLSKRKRNIFHGRTESVSVLRRYLLYFTDVLDIYLSIQRDRRWRKEDRDDW